MPSGLGDILVGGKPLSYWLGPNLTAGLDNVGLGYLVEALRRDPVGAARTTGEVVGPQADVLGMVESSRLASENFRRGNLGAGLLDTGYVAGNLATLFLPGALGTRKTAEGTRNFVLFDDDAARLLARDDVRFDLDEASRKTIYRVVPDGVSEAKAFRPERGRGVYAFTDLDAARSFQSASGGKIVSAEIDDFSPRFVDDFSIELYPEGPRGVVANAGDSGLVPRGQQLYITDSNLIDPTTAARADLPMDEASRMKKDSTDILAGIGGVAAAGGVAASLGDAEAADLSSIVVDRQVAEDGSEVEITADIALEDIDSRLTALHRFLHGL